MVNIRERMFDPKDSLKNLKRYKSVLSEDSKKALLLYRKSESLNYILVSAIHSWILVIPCPGITYDRTSDT